MPDEVKLLPCPLCAAEIDRTYYGPGQWSYSHGDCATDCVLRGLHFGDENVASWNTRAIEATRPTDMEVRDAE